ncbi:MAG: GNAT family N-acetyltransferase [Treponema sp.]|jgi:ribosomal protein S18 acetylase RimI-like enzyme|nr:GNAT family N-acetyltransferase [Treponema sp.]
MNVQYGLAEAGDYGELIDFCNYVFSHAHSPTDFPVLLPKLYRREYFTLGRHYTAREDGRIRAVVGAYPLCLNVLGTALAGRGIGMVSVHPYARSRGYMRTLMETALADMRRDGIVFGCLGGQRQRYEYFGFSPAGLRTVFECHRTNIRHVLGKDTPPVFSIRRLNEGDRELEDAYQIHQSKAARFERDRGKFFDILSSWKNRVFALSDKSGFAGYLVCNDTAIPELNLKNPALMIHAIASFLNHLDRDRVSVDVQPWETEKLEAFAAFAENCHTGTAQSFTVLDWQPLLAALLRLKTASGQVLPDGEALFRISRGDNAAEDSCFRVSVERGRAQVSPGTGAIVLDPLRAIRLFFSAPPWASPVIRNDPFLRGILPLPLFFESPDGV